MKTLRTILLGSVLAVAAASPALADGGFSGTAAVTTNYLFRGISQNADQPAIQASLGYAFGDTGFSVGAWGSTIDFTDFGDTKSSIEADYYANYAFSIDNLDVTLGATYYTYPTSTGAWDYDYFEGSVALAYDFGPVAWSGSVWYSPEFFGGIGDAWYVQTGLSVPITDWLSAAGNYGYQTFDIGGDYSNWNLGLTATYDKYSLNVMYSQTDLPTPYDDGKFVATLSAAF